MCRFESLVFSAEMKFREFNHEDDGHVSACSEPSFRGRNRWLCLGVLVCILDLQVSI